MNRVYSESEKNGKNAFVAFSKRFYAILRRKLNWCKNPKINFRSEQSSKNFCSALDEKRRKVCKEEQIRLSDHNYCWFNEFFNTILHQRIGFENQQFFIYTQKDKLTVKIFESRKDS
jgi:hypothetical protein